MTGVDNNVQSIGRAYDTLGRTETVSSYAGTTTGSTVLNQIKYVYGTHGRITKSTQDHSGAVGGTEPNVQYAYDDSAASNIYEDGLRLETMTYPNSRVVFYGYDNGTQGTLRDRSDRIAEIRETNATGQQLATYQYSGVGRVANTVYVQPDIHQHADRDADDVYEIWDRFGRTLQAYWRPTTGTGNNYLDRLDYGYDYAGNRTYRNVRVDTISGSSLDERDQAYTYDGLYRVNDTDQGTANDTTGAITTKKFEQQWKLDQLGNWEEFDQDDDGNGTWELEQSRTHNDVNEVTAVDLQSMGAGNNWADPAFDAAGNMTTMPQPGSLTSSYTSKYDAWNRLVSLDSGSTASYEYDGLNRRIKRTEGSTTRHFYYNESWQCLEERSTESGSAVKQFVWGTEYIDDLVLRDRDADANSGNGLEERLYALQDALYNVTALVNTSASLQERFAYTPYGVSTVLNVDMTVKSGGTGYAWEHRYNGRRLDPVSGLQLNRNRYYHQQLGRWCSRDPIGYEDGANLHSTYDMLKAVDPLGLFVEAIVTAWQPPLGGWPPGKDSPYPVPVDPIFDFPHLGWPGPSAKELYGDCVNIKYRGDQMCGQTHLNCVAKCKPLLLEGRCRRKCKSDYDCCNLNTEWHVADCKPNTEYWCPATDLLEDLAKEQGCPELGYPIVDIPNQTKPERPKKPVILPGIRYPYPPIW